MTDNETKLKEIVNDLLDAWDIEDEGDYFATMASLLENVKRMRNSGRLELQMKKFILEIELFNERSCVECPCHSYHESGPDEYYFCGLLNCETPMDANHPLRPDWCPLKEQT